MTRKQRAQVVIQALYNELAIDLWHKEGQMDSLVLTKFRLACKLLKITLDSDPILPRRKKP